MESCQQAVGRLRIAPRGRGECDTGEPITSRASLRSSTTPSLRRTCTSGATCCEVARTRSLVGNPVASALPYAEMGQTFLLESGRPRDRSNLCRRRRGKDMTARSC